MRKVSKLARMLAIEFYVASHVVIFGKNKGRVRYRTVERKNVKNCTCI